MTTLSIHHLGRVLAVAGAVAVPAFTLSNEAWAQGQGGDGRNPELQRMVDDLKGVIERAERRQSADPRLLRRLRRLVRRYDWPWRRVVFTDSFRDGEFTHNPTWTVASGRFWVERQLGLRSEQEPRRDRRYGRERRGGDQDFAQDLLGTVIEGLNRGNDEDRKRGRRRGWQPSEIFLPRRIADAFAIRLRLRATGSRRSSFSAGPYRGADRTRGYRLAYDNRGGPSLRLTRIDRNGSRVLQSVDRAPMLDDGNPHDLLWTQDIDGEIEVRIDGRAVIETADRVNRRDYSGLTLVNGGGVLSIRRIEVSDDPRAAGRR